VDSANGKSSHGPSLAAAVALLAAEPDGVAEAGVAEAGAGCVAEAGAGGLPLFPHAAATIARTGHAQRLTSAL
jgi:hypothetical protein